MSEGKSSLFGDGVRQCLPVENANSVTEKNSVSIYLIKLNVYKNTLSVNGSFLPKSFSV